jgi:hypothetical protein
MDTGAISRLLWLATGSLGIIWLLASQINAQLTVVTHRGFQRMAERGEDYVYQV